MGCSREFSNCIFDECYEKIVLDHKSLSECVLEPIEAILTKNENLDFSDFSDFSVFLLRFQFLMMVMMDGWGLWGGIFFRSGAKNIDFRVEIRGKTCF